HAPDSLFAFRQRMQQKTQLIFTPADGRGDSFRSSYRRVSAPIYRERFRLRRMRNRLAGYALQQLTVSQYRSGSDVNQQHLPGAQPPALDDLLFVELNDTGFGAGNHPSIRRVRVAKRTKTVAIQLGAHDASIAEGQGRGTVPRLILGADRFQMPLHLGLNL